MKPLNEICLSVRVARTLMLGCTLIAIANLTAIARADQQGNGRTEPADSAALQARHSQDTSGTAGTVSQESHEMPAVVSHHADAHVTETMASHPMPVGPHMKFTELRPQSPEDLKRADEIVKALRASLQKYADYRGAIKDGYLPYLPNVPQRQYHFTNYGYGYLEAFRFDPAYPTSLLYKKTPTGYDLVGAMYTAPEKTTEDALNARVPLSVAQWHLHVNICLPQGGMAKIADWTRFGPAGSITTEKDCTEAGGKFMPHLFGWMVHVYPFEQTAEKIWTH